jgi:hypothetical protein
MLPFTLLPPAPCSPSIRFITSATLATDIPPSNIVPPMHPRVNFLGFPTSSRPPPIQRSVGKRTSTGRIGIPSRRTVVAVAASAIPIFPRSKARRAAVCQNGLMRLVDGPAHRGKICAVGVFTFMPMGTWMKHGIVRSIGAFCLGLFRHLCGLRVGWRFPCYRTIDYPGRICHPLPSKATISRFHVDLLFPTLTAWR